MKNTSAEGVEFVTAVTITTLFEHHQNNFILSDIDNSSFTDYDGDGVNDDEDGYPKDDSQQEFDNNSANAEKMSSPIILRDTKNRLEGLDSSDAKSPIIVNSYNTTIKVKSTIFSIDENYEFRAKGDEGISILDITNIEDVELVGEINIEAYAKEMILSTDESQLFVVDGKGKVIIVDIDDFENPFVVKSFDSRGFIYGLSISNDRSTVSVVDENGLVDMMLIEEFEESFQ